MHKAFFVCFALLISIHGFGQDPKWKTWETEADTLLEHQQYDRAIVLYNKVLKKISLESRESYGVIYKRAIAYYSSGYYPEALRDLEAFIPQYPQVPQARILRALVYKELGDSKKQLEDLNTVLELQSGDPGLLKWRASIYLDEGEYQLARTDAEKAREIHDDAEVEMYLGFAAYYLNDFENALQYINKAIELDASYLPPYLYGGTFCLEQEQYEKAVKYLDLALRLDPDNITAVMYKGMALVELDRVDEGCRCLRKAFYSGEDSADDYLKEYCYGIDP